MQVTFDFLSVLMPSAGDRTAGLFMSAASSAVITATLERLLCKLAND